MRDIDLNLVSPVINYDMPNDLKDLRTRIIISGIKGQVFDFYLFDASILLNCVKALGNLSLSFSLS